MPEKKINLNEIWKRKFPHGKLPDYAREIAMEFAKKLLELAAENAETEKEMLPECGVLKSVGVVDKQSILDTINQIE